MGNIFKKYECFGIDISVVDKIFEFNNKRKIIRRQDASSVFAIQDPIVINADPFLFVHENRLYLFYEQTTFINPGGRILMTSTEDLKNWSYPVQISTDNNMHFSFPFVFEDNGVIYMIPETGWSSEIRLYKAVTDDLSKFELDSVLLKRATKKVDIIFDYADNVLYKKNGTYFLFTSIMDKNGYQLQLYISKNLRGPYLPHPASPICHNFEYGRNAGSIIECEGKLYRPTQDCSKTYGGQVNIMEITRLTPDKYEETLFRKHLLPTSESFYRQGGHQLNYVKFNGKLVMASDAKRDRSFPVKRVVDRLKRFVGK